MSRKAAEVIFYLLFDLSESEYEDCVKGRELFPV